MGKYRLTYDPFVHDAVITTAITIAAGKAIVRKHDPTLLEENNGPLQLTSNWGKSDGT